MTRILGLVGLSGALVLATAALGADAGGAMIGRTCNGCHGTDGLSKAAVPSLRLPAEYLEKSLQDFKSGARPATIMDRIARGYSDSELAAVAQYFGGFVR